MVWSGDAPRGGALLSDDVLPSLGSGPAESKRSHGRAGGALEGGRAGPPCKGEQRRAKWYLSPEVGGPGRLGVGGMPDRPSKAPRRVLAGPETGRRVGRPRKG